MLTFVTVDNVFAMKYNNCMIFDNNFYNIANNILCKQTIFEGGSRC